MDSPLVTMLARLQSDGGRYLLSVGLTKEERDALQEPTFGGKGFSRWLTEREHAELIIALQRYLDQKKNSIADTSP